MKNDPEMTFIGASVEHGADLAAAERAAMERPKMAEALTAARGMRVGRTVAANFPPFETLPADNAFSLKRGEPLKVTAARADAGRSLLVQDIAQLEQRLIAQGLTAAERAATYCGIPIIEVKHLPPDTVYIVTDSASSASLIAALRDVLPLMGKKT